MLSERKIAAGFDLAVALPKGPGLEWCLEHRSLEQEAIMNPTGAVFRPELITLMKSVLEEVATMLPEARRTSTVKAEIASLILASAAKGERDPEALKMAALLAVVECTHYSHDISLERRAV
jgi:hypothetical protein